MYNIKITVTIFILCVFTIVKAQTDFQDGYIITSDFDTIYGKIDNRNYNYNAHYCDFKKINSDSIITYFPDQLFGYRFNNGKYYLSKEFQNNKIFMEFLINGNLDIYFYQDKQNKNHYYASKDTIRLQELKYEKGIKYIDGRDRFYESKEYVGILNFFTYDCPEIKNEIPKLNEPNHKNLIEFAKNYHSLTCENEECIIYAKEIPRKIKMSIYGGTNIFFPYYTNLERKVYPSFGVNLMFQQAQDRERLFLGIGFFSDGEADSSNNVYRLPLSLNYLNPRQGFSTIFAYQLDLNSLFLSEAIELGVKYQMKKISTFFVVDIKTVVFVIPYSTSVNIGFTYDFR